MDIKFNTVLCCCTESLPLYMCVCAYIYIYVYVCVCVYSVLAFSTQVREAVGFLRAKKSSARLPSEGKYYVKPSVPCRRFAECKRSLYGVEVVISAKLPDNILAHSSTFRC